MRLIEKVWFYQHKAKYWLVPLLLPLSLLFFLLSQLRRVLFKLGFKQSVKLDCPVIIVGNIGVGGNGKTPVVVYLVKLAQQLGFRPGVISRGYGGNAPSYPYLLNEQSTAIEAGDEPMLIFKRCNVPVCVGSDRVASAKTLIKQGCNIIISDDGLQHYRLQRDKEIIVIDNKRLFGNGLLLPAGPLRETTTRLNSADLLIFNGEGKPKKVVAASTLPSLSMELGATKLCNLVSGQQITVNDFMQLHTMACNAIAGIGAPERFFASLQKLGFTLNAQQGFFDHHSFMLDDFSQYPDTIPLIMTEKDAVKCREFAKENWWYLPVDAVFSSKHQQQIEVLLSSCRKEMNSDR
ncbi:tetraacyldisaccharide 4'-kinase [Colwellia sp. RSH04]|uniref:tetraacyldisaccharide 4'-kinase n=1 Tax=Colwellia sp. RSH04 TaxID=2305464 RepID=UPI000E58C021|nr:tetraacyldisaccharide 4'-kinase [Colwellia sp. RSH04]RHW76151.1 tetraacyldisaccharide 4'-kinase [Colwellia sp. RSH04]